MKAITVHQPAASLIAAGLKTIETRTHNRFACLVGQRIAIHAGQQWDGMIDMSAAQYLFRRGRAVLNSTKTIDMHLHGVVLCTALVQDARPLHGDADSDAALCYADHRHGLIVTDIERLDPPVPARGRQGIWNWSPEAQS